MVLVLKLGRDNKNTGIHKPNLQSAANPVVVQNSKYQYIIENSYIHSHEPDLCTFYNDSIRFAIIRQISMLTQNLPKPQRWPNDLNLRYTTEKSTNMPRVLFDQESKLVID